MMLSFSQQYRPSGRIIAHLGMIPVGWIYPEDGRWRWKLHLPCSGDEKIARSELSAKTKLSEALGDWLCRAGLPEAPT